MTFISFANERPILTLSVVLGAGAFLAGLSGFCIADGMIGHDSIEHTTQTGVATAASALLGTSISLMTLVLDLEKPRR